MNRRRFLTALGALCVGACSSKPPLAHGQGSAEALAAAVLDAFGHSDRDALENLALSEAEFRDHVWPDLPAARPERNLPFSYVWGDLHQKSTINLSELLGKYGRQQFKLQRVSFAQQTQYAHSVVHRDATFVVTDVSGAEQSLRLCGSFLQQNRTWKVFSYLVDD